MVGDTDSQLRELQNIRRPYFHKQIFPYVLLCKIDASDQ